MGTTHTAPDGTTVKSSKVVYTNNGYYYLANLFDGSLATPDYSTCRGNHEAYCYTLFNPETSL